MKSINQLVDKLFTNAIYSRQVNIAKWKIVSVLREKYDELLKSGKNEIEAMGKIMSTYGTLKDAGNLAGYSEEEINSWRSENITEKLVEKDTFLKFFKIIRLKIYILSFLIAFVVTGIIRVFMNNSFENYMYIFMGSLFAVLFGVSLYRSENNINYKKDIYSYYARGQINRSFDKYTKRLINSMHLAVAGAFVELYIFLAAILSAGMTPWEAFISLFSSTIPLGIIVFLIAKNTLCKYAIDRQYSKVINKRFDKYMRISLGISVAYWIMVDGLVLMMNKVLDKAFDMVAIAAVFYGVKVIAANLVVRKRVVFSNVTINIKRAVVVGILIASVLSYQVMQMNEFILQPYISTVKSVAPKEDIISYDDDSGVYTITTDKDNFKILQLTDIHLGGSAATVVKDYSALKACEELIKRARPDLVVVTGDLVFPVGVMSFSFNTKIPIIEFANFMRNIGVPWAFAYGNHDTEVVANGTEDEIINTFKSLSYKSSKSLLYPYVQPDIKGRNNQLIKIRNSNGKLNQALFLLDSNDYVSGINDYDYIHDDQVLWYAKQIKKMNKQEGKKVSSILFFHIPLQQYKTANNLYEAGSDKVKYFFGENKEKMIDKVCSSKYPSKLFDTAKKLGSSKAMFCGHDHYNNMSVEYQGIRLTYGMSIDYLAMPGIDKDIKQRGATLITLHEDSSYDIKQVKYGK